MSITLTQKRENNTVELEVTVSADALKEATDRVFKRRVKSITVPGFRKGKAPRSIIEKMYGEGIFLEDAVNDLYPGAYNEAVEEAGIEPVDQANIEILDLEREKGFTFKATVTVKPEITVGNYKGLKGEKTIYPVSDEEIQAQLEGMRERGARIISVEDRAAKTGDIANIDFEGFVDGEPFEGGKSEGYEIELGSNSFIDTFEEQIAGHGVGDEFEVNVTFPEDYHTEELKGKPAVFKVKLNSLQEKELPELDDEFAKDVSEFDTIEELRADLRANREKANAARSDDELESQLVGQVIETIEGDIPEVMYDSKVEDLLREFEYRISQQGMNLQLYMQYTGMDLDAMREGYREQAIRQVKVRLALEAVAAAEKLEVTDEDVEKEYAKVAENYGMEAEQVKTMIRRKDLEKDIACTKALDLIRDSAEVTEKEFVPEPPAAEEEKPEEKPKKALAKKAAPKKAAAKKEDAGDEEKTKKAPAKKTAAKKETAEAETE